MPYKAFVLHHSACANINGKGYDFLIMENGGIIPGTEPTDPDYLHLCLEGDFNRMPIPLPQERIEQVFVLNKLLQRLYPDIAEHRELLLPHDAGGCPGRCFPWEELVISKQEGYH